MNGIPTTRRCTAATKQVWPAKLQSPLTQRLAQRFYGISLGLALPVAVFTSNGLLGLLIHAIALSGAATLLEQSSHKYARTCSAPGKETSR